MRDMVALFCYLAGSVLLTLLGIKIAEYGLTGLGIVLFMIPALVRWVKK